MTIIQNIIQPIIKDIIGDTIGFKPTDLSGLLLWFDASDLGTVISSGNIVSDWLDKSGNNHHSDQGVGARQPLTNININGVNAIFWDGETDDNDVLVIPADAALSNVFATGGTLVFASNADSATGSAEFPRLLKIESETAIALANQGNEILMPVPFSDTGAVFRADSNFIGVPAITMITYNGSNVNNEPAFYRDGALLSTVVTREPIGTIDSGSGRIFIGNDANPGNRTWAGTIGEVIFYNRILTSTEIGTIHAYLSSAWNIPLA